MDLESFKKFEKIYDEMPKLPTFINSEGKECYRLKPFNPNWMDNPTQKE